MSEERDDFSEPLRETPDRDRADWSDHESNPPATASIWLVAAAWAVSIFSAVGGWLPGSYLSGAIVLAAIPVGIWGLRRAKASRGAGKGRAITGLAGAGVTLVLPFTLLWYVQDKRDKAALALEQNSLKQIGIALLNHHDAQGYFAPTAFDPVANDFNSGLSWRVDMLPYIEAQGLYMKFNLHEPWDGPTNRKLADARLRVYVSPFDPPGTTQTRYHIFVGGGAIFEYGKRTRIDEIRDGTAHTILVVEGREAAPWPQPFDLPYSPDRPVPPLGREDAKGFSVMMADGSARFVRKGVSEQTLRAAISAVAGDRPGPDW